MSVALYHEGSIKTELVLERQEAVRPIDRRAIVSEQAALARATVESRPPRPQPGLFTPHVELRESYDDALARFEEELEEFSHQLGAWVVAYESRIWPSATYVEAWIWVENSGEAPAEEVSVELELDAGLLRAARPPAIDFPPEPPRFERRPFGPPHIPSLTYPRPPKPAEEALGAVNGPSWVAEDGRVIARFRASKLLHGTRDFSAYPLRLVPEEVGLYEIRWTVRAANLREPAAGLFSLDARPQPRADEPVRTLSQLLEPGDVALRQPGTTASSDDSAP